MGHRYIGEREKVKQAVSSLVYNTVWDSCPVKEQSVSNNH